MENRLKHGLDRKRPNSDGVTRHWPSRFDWRDLVLPALPRSYELVQHMSYVIKNLEPEQTYEVEIISR